MKETHFDIKNILILMHCILVLTLPCFSALAMLAGHLVGKICHMAVAKLGPDWSVTLAVRVKQKPKIVTRCFVITGAISNVLQMIYA